MMYWSRAMFIFSNRRNILWPATGQHGSQQQAAANPPAPVIQPIRFTEPRLPPSAFYSGEPQLCHPFFSQMLIIHLASTFCISHGGIQGCLCDYFARGKSGQLGNDWSRDFRVMLPFKLFLMSSERFLIGLLLAETRHIFLQSCDREIKRSKTIQLNFARWRQSVAGMPRHNGTCFYTDFLSI